MPNERPLDPSQWPQPLKEIKGKLEEVSPSFCVAKWYQATLHLHNGNTQSCHHVKSHQVPLKEVRKNPATLHNSGKKIKVRQQMLSGRRPTECDYCWKMEDRGQISDRLMKSSEVWAAPHMGELLEQPLSPETPPRHLEVAFDNLCNFKCMYCSPVFSSRWLEEIKQYGAYPTQRRFNNLWQMRWDKNRPLPEEQRREYVEAFFAWWPELCQQLHFLNITGGEPLMIAETYRLLQRIENKPCPHLHLGVNSNLGVSQKSLDKFLTQVKKLQKGSVKSFTLFTSLDSVGEQAEYIRFGLNFEKFKNSCHHVLSTMTDPIELSFMMTINALSLPGLQKLLKFFLQLRQQYPQHRLSFASPYLRYPQHLALDILPPEFSKYVDEALTWMQSQQGFPMGFTDLEITQVSRLKTLLEKPTFSEKKITSLRKDFYKSIQETDRRRQLDFLRTFPEFKDFMSQCAQL